MGGKYGKGIQDSAVPSLAVGGKGQGCGSAEMQGVRQAGLTGVSGDYEGFERVLGVSS